MCTLTASIITAVAGGLWQGYTANQQAKAQARQAEQNAQIADQNAQKLQEQAEQQAENNRSMKKINIVRWWENWPGSG